MDLIKISSALISVYDKNGLDPLLDILVKNQVQIYSTGGTKSYIDSLGYSVTAVEDVTSYPSILGGRVKTLHPKIFGGILNRKENKSDIEEIKKYDVPQIDLVIVDLYPFEETVKLTNDESKIIEKIDIGGVSLLRASAKNYSKTLVVSSKNNYNEFINHMDKNNYSSDIKFRKKYASKAFAITSEYDSQIDNFFGVSSGEYPQLRYGENPHQKAAIYSIDKSLEISQLHGKKLSYNNYNDMFSALNLSKTLPKNIGTIIIKHANPCGVSINKNKVNSYKEAYACDPVSAFGGIVLCNFKVTNKLAIELNKIFIEVIIGVGFNKDALKALKRKKNLRIIDISKFNFESYNNIKINFNSFLLQSPDNKIFKKNNFKIVSKKKPNNKTFNNLIFSFNVCRSVKSNAIVLTKDKATVGIGSGQPSRIDSCKIAISKMKKFQKNNINDEIIAASDAFFPFTDGMEALVQAGVTAIIQPSGSIRDKDIIKFADKVGIVLVFSKTRHFNH